MRTHARPVYLFSASITPLFSFFLSLFFKESFDCKSLRAPRPRALSSPWRAHTPCIKRGAHSTSSSYPQEAVPCHRAQVARANLRRPSDRRRPARRWRQLVPRRRHSRSRRRRRRRRGAAGGAARRRAHSRTKRMHARRALHPRAWCHFQKKRPGSLSNVCPFAARPRSDGGSHLYHCTRRN